MTEKICKNCSHWQPLPEWLFKRPEGWEGCGKCAVRLHEPSHGEWLEIDIYATNPTHTCSRWEPLDQRG